MTRRASARPSLAPDEPSVPDISARFARMFGVAAPDRPADFLAAAIAWKEQVIREGDVTSAVSRDLAIIADDLRRARLTKVRGDAAVSSGGIQAPHPYLLAQPLPPASSQLLPGARLVKLHGGTTHVVEVQEDGFLYAGEMYRSLSGIAKAITGTHWNGLLFFGLRKRKLYPKRETA